MGAEAISLMTIARLAALYFFKIGVDMMKPRLPIKKTSASLGNQTGY